MPVKNVANDKHNHIEIKLGIPEILSYQINQPSAAPSVPRYKVNEVEALLSKLVDFKGSRPIGPNDLKSLTNVDALQSRDKWLSNFVIDAYMNSIQSFRDIKIRVFHGKTLREYKPSTSKMVKCWHFLHVIIPCNKPHIEH